MSNSVPWAKIWWTWYTSRSHIGLSGVALALGAPLMLIGRACAGRHSDANGDASGDEQRSASSDCVSDLVWLKNEDGSIVTAADLAAISRFSVDQVADALKALVGRKTLKINDDGCYGIVNFWKYQESAAAARTRRYRSKEKRHSDATGDGHGDGHGDGKSDDKREEGRGKSNSDPPTLTARAGAPAELPLPAAAENDQSDPDPEPGEPLPADADRMRSHELVRLRFGERFYAARTVPVVWDPDKVKACQVIGKWLDDQSDDAKQFTLKLARLLDGFFADTWTKSVGFPIADLAKRPDVYFLPPPARAAGPLFAPPGMRQGTRLQPTRPSPPAAFANAPSVEEQLEQARQKKARQSNGSQ